eukprot:450481_1
MSADMRSLSNWKFFSGFLCVLNITTVLYFGEYILNNWTVTIPPVQQYPIQPTGASATSGKLFKMDRKIRTFTNLKYSKITMKSSNNIKLSYNKQCKSDNWIVLTTIFNVTSAILDYNNINDWCTVIAGDKKSLNKKLYNSYLNTNKVVYLDVNDQKQIFKISNAFDTYNIIPFNHFGRKNIGFLYAIMNGAKYIYDTDDDNKIIEPYNKNGIPILGFNSKNEPFKIKTIVDERIKNELTFNVFLLWSDDYIWPRGYDISALTESFKWHKTVKLEIENYENNAQENPYIIQQWLSNIEPDYDAIQRLIGKNIDFNGKDFPMEYIFDINENNNFAISMPNNLYIPFNAQMTIWDYRSFLFLYLPITVHGRVSDIWR